MSNLLFLNVWTQLLDRSAVNYFQKTLSVAPLLIVTAGNIALIGSLLYVSFRWGRRLKGFARDASEVAFLGFLLIPLNMARTRILRLGVSNLLQHRIVVPLVAALCGIAWQTVRYRQPLIRIARPLVLLFLPLLPLGVAEVALGSGAGRPDRALTASHVQPSPPGHLRAVLVIFDEFDECMAFSMRPPGVALPELDRLQTESFFSMKARPPGSATLRSIPSLFTGKYVEEAEAAESNDLSIRYRGERGFHLWSKEPNVFRAANSSGFNTGLAGWYNPYCRLFSFTTCEWEGASSVFLREDYANALWLLPSMLLQLRLQLAEVPALGFTFHSIVTTPSAQVPSLRSTSRAQAIREYRDIHQAAMRRLRDRNLDLVFLHWPVPHPFYFFDRRTGDFTTRDGANYFDALALVDRTVGDIRSALEKEGVWDETALLISSDHPLRVKLAQDLGAWSQEEQSVLGEGSCSYIPFILKMPGQRRAMEYDHDAEVDTLVSGSLLLAILKGEVKSPEEASQWLRARPR